MVRKVRRSRGRGKGGPGAPVRPTPNLAGHGRYFTGMDAQRRNPELQRRWRRVWWTAMLVSAGVHLALFLLFRADIVAPPSPFSAAGPRSGDPNAAAGGGMQAVAMRIRMPEAPQPIPRPPAPPPVPAEGGVEVEAREPAVVEQPHAEGARAGGRRLGVRDRSGPRRRRLHARAAQHGRPKLRLQAAGARSTVGVRAGEARRPAGRRVVPLHDHSLIAAAAVSRTASRLSSDSASVPDGSGRAVGPSFRRAAGCGRDHRRGMILRRFGSRIHEVKPNFDARAMTEIS